MRPPLAQANFETTLAERVDVATRTSRRIVGRWLWRFTLSCALLGSATVVIAIQLLEPDQPASRAWLAGAITLGILAVLLPAIVVLVPRVGVRAALLRATGPAPRAIQVELTTDAVTATDSYLRLSLSWAGVQNVGLDRDRIVITGRAATFFVPRRAFASDADYAAFLALAQRLAAGAAAHT